MARNLPMSNFRKHTEHISQKLKQHYLDPQFQRLQTMPKKYTRNGIVPIAQRHIFRALSQKLIHTAGTNKHKKKRFHHNSTSGQVPGIRAPVSHMWSMPTIMQTLLRRSRSRADFLIDFTLIFGWQLSGRAFSRPHADDDLAEVCICLPVTRLKSLHCVICVVAETTMTKTAPRYSPLSRPTNQALSLGSVTGRVWCLWKSFWWPIHCE